MPNEIESIETSDSLLRYDGTVVITAPEVPEVETIEAGTYRFNDEITETFTGVQELNFKYYISALEEYTYRTCIWAGTVMFSDVNYYGIKYTNDDDDYSAVYSKGYMDWNHTDNQTIYIDEAQSVSSAFKLWFTANTVKQ
jgi:hypothetical protein